MSGHCATGDLHRRKENPKEGKIRQNPLTDGTDPVSGKPMELALPAVECQTLRLSAHPPSAPPNSRNPFHLKHVVRISGYAHDCRHKCSSWNTMHYVPVGTLGQFAGAKNHKAGLVGPALFAWNWIGQSCFDQPIQNVKVSVTCALASVISATAFSDH